MTKTREISDILTGVDIEGTITATGSISSTPQGTLWGTVNDGVGSGLNADLLDGYHASTTRNAANTIPIRDANGYLQLGWINTTSGATTSTINKIYASNDGYIRYVTPATLISQLGIWTSGNDGAGSGLDADIIDGWNFTNSGSNSAVNADTINSNGITYYTSGVTNFSGNSTDGALYSQRYSDAWQHQIAADYRSGQIAVRGKNNGTWTAWNKVWTAGNDGSGSGLDADTVDGVQASSIMQLTGAQTITGEKYFRSDRNTTSSNPPLQAYSSGGSGAIMSFHRGGAYAINFGLDSDNVIRFGGWSAAANRLQMDMSGNLTMAGNVTAYSDIRLKENINVIPDALDKVQQIRGVTFTRNDVDDLEQLHTGVIAQEVETVLPMAVSEDNNGVKNVAYGNMVGLLIEAIKELKAEVEQLKSEK